MKTFLDTRFLPFLLFLKIKRDVVVIGYSFDIEIDSEQKMSL